MAATPSTMMPLGTLARSFSLPDTVSGKIVTLESVRGTNGTVIMFLCNHCPYVLHILNEIIKTANENIPRGISFVAISSNDAVNYPQDGPVPMKIHAQKFRFPFPYLYDETQDVARAYDAACTPDIFVFDKELKCVYRGQFDGSRPKNDLPVTGVDLRKALEAIIENCPVSDVQIPSIGCNIKWKA